jgi:hypothetical protein
MAPHFAEVSPTRLVTPVSVAELKAARIALEATSQALAATRHGRDEHIEVANQAAARHWKKISEQYLDEAMAITRG